MKAFSIFPLLYTIFLFDPVMGQELFQPLDEEPIPLNFAQFTRQISYPVLAQQGGIEGLVQVLVRVDAYGNYVEHMIVRSVHPLLSEAVDPFVACLNFQPAMYEGRYVATWTAIPLRFRLKDLPRASMASGTICPDTPREVEMPVARN